MIEWMCLFYWLLVLITSRHYRIKSGRDDIHGANIAHKYLGSPTCVLSRGESEFEHWVHGAAHQPSTQATGCPNRVSGGMVNAHYGKPIAFLQWH